MRCAEAGVKLRPAGKVDDFVPVCEVDRLVREFESAVEEEFENAPEREAPNDVRRVALSLSLSWSSGRRDVDVEAEEARGSIGVRCLSTTGRCFGEVDFDFLRSSEKKEDEEALLLVGRGRAGLVGAVEVGVGFEEVGVGGFELREFDRDGEEVLESDR